MSIEAMKQALEALEIGWSTKYLDFVDAREKGMAAITSLRQAIKDHAMYEVQRLGQEIEQEPVALPCCGYDNPEAVKFNSHNQVVQCHHCGQVYTPQRQPLNFEQRMDIVKKCDGSVTKGILLTEAAHGIKGEA